MTGKKTSRIPVFIFIAAMVALFPFSTYGQSGRVARVTIGTTMEVKKLGIDDRTYGVMMGLFTHRSLTRFSSDGDITGDLASSWDSPDATSWTIKIRSGVKWHDGQPVTAEDVAFTYKYLMEKYPVYVRHFNLVKDVRAINPSTVHVQLKRPNSRFIVNVCNIEILPKHIFQKVDDPRSFLGSKAAVGCGPFIFHSFDRKNGILKFVTNKANTPARPNVDEVSVRIFKNTDTLYLALKKGEVDLPYKFPMDTDATALIFLKNLDYISLSSTQNIGVPKALFFNTEKPPVNDPALRRALSLAINYQEMIDLISGGYGYWPNTGFAPPGTLGFIKTEPVQHAPEKAKKILAGLGYETENADGFLIKDGKPLALDCIIFKESIENRRVAELLKRDFKNIGVELIPKYVDSNVFQSMVNRQKNYTMILHRTTPWGMMSYAGCGSAYVDERNMGWTSTEDVALVRIIDRMNKAASEKMYQKAAADLQQYYSKNIIVAPLFWNALVFPYNNRLSGWKMDCNDGILNWETWFSLKEEVSNDKVEQPQARRECFKTNKKRFAQTP